MPTTFKQYNSALGIWELKPWVPVFPKVKRTARVFSGRGISLDQHSKKWKAYIYLNGKQKVVARCKTAEEALTARNEALVKYCKVPRPSNKALGSCN